MAHPSLRIVFFGTPGFAVPSLRALHGAGHQIVAVVTAPDKPAGRGLKMQPSEVKLAAEELGLPVMQPEKLKRQEFLDQLKSLNADLGVIIAFRMLPEAVWSAPKLGTVNLHASLLPQYRGAAPINWAIINGEMETGLTTFFLQHEIDTGNIIYQRRITIGAGETAGQLHDRMMEDGARLMLKTVNDIAAGTAPSAPQTEARVLKPAPKIFKEHCQIDWQKPVKEVYNLIRGMSPYPAAFTLWEGKVFKIYHAEMEEDTHNEAFGSLSTVGGRIRIACHEGFIIPLEVQIEGKKKMDINAFLNGQKTIPSVAGV